MKDYILFSPLGMTDPTRGFRDGAFIHICRHYMPKKVYLYMSKEICGLDRNNIYEYALSKLCELKNFKCDVIKFKRPELKDVHIFDAFFDDFIQCIKTMHSENPDTVIILNLSSGTPAMKSALLIIAQLLEMDFLPVQVATPEKESNKEKTVDMDYSFEEEWILNQDNEPGAENRCEEVQSRNFNAMIKKEIIIKHIEAYDYKAALRVAETIPDYIGIEGMSLLEAAAYRYDQNLQKAQSLSDKIKYDMFPVKSSYKSRQHFEFILWLQIKQRRGDLADFMRGISPILTNLFETYLKEFCRIDILEYCETKRKGKAVYPMLKRSLLPQNILDILDKSFKEKFKDSPLSATNMLYIIKEYCNDPEVVNLTEQLRRIEDMARNIAAHQIQAIMDSWVKDQTKYNTMEILDMIKKIAMKTEPGATSAVWKSYDLMNDKIRELIK